MILRSSSGILAAFLDRHADFAGKAPDRGSRHSSSGAFRRIGDDDAVDENARYMHLFRFDRTLFDDALDLRDDDAAMLWAAMACARLSSMSASRSMVILPKGSAVVPRMNATSIGGTIEQPLLALDLDQLDDVLLGDLVDTPAPVTRIDIGVEADLGEEARLAGGAGAVKLRDDALREIVAADLVLLRRLRTFGMRPKLAAITRRSNPSWPRRLKPLACCRLGRRRTGSRLRGVPVLR